MPVADLRTAAAARQRRYRQRVSASIWVVGVAVNFDDIDFLIETGLLDAALSEDRRAVGAALARLLAKCRDA